MTQLEDPRPTTVGGSNNDTGHRDTQLHNGVPHSGGPITHRRDSWQDDVFDRHPSEFDPH